MNNLEKFIETLDSVPIRQTACFIQNNFEFPCKLCVYHAGHPFGTSWCTAKTDEAIFAKHPTWSSKDFCIDGIKQWLESEVEV